VAWVSVIFISHASADDAFVAELRQRLEASQIPVWVDSRGLRGRSKLAPVGISHDYPVWQGVDR
jgi:hypothetical protein